MELGAHKAGVLQSHKANTALMPHGHS